MLYDSANRESFDDWRPLDEAKRLDKFNCVNFGDI